MLPRSWHRYEARVEIEASAIRNYDYGRAGYDDVVLTTPVTVLYMRYSIRDDLAARSPDFSNIQVAGSGDGKQK